MTTFDFTADPEYNDSFVVRTVGGALLGRVTATGGGWVIGVNQLTKRYPTRLDAAQALYAAHKITDEAMGRHLPYATTYASVNVTQGDPKANLRIIAQHDGFDQSFTLDKAQMVDLIESLARSLAYT
jgi:transposase-like protein